MKHKYSSLIALCIILLMNIIFTQKMIHQYFYENYQNAVIYAVLNIIVFPVAILIYRWDVKQGGKEKREQQ